MKVFFSFICILLLVSSVKAKNEYQLEKYLNILIGEGNSAILHEIKQQNYQEYIVVDMLYNNTVNKNILTLNNAPETIIQYLKTGLQYKKFWDTIDINSYHMILNFYENNSTIKLLCAIVLKLRDPTLKNIDLAIPPVQKIEKKEDAFFYGIYICNNLKDKQKCWKYFYLSLNESDLFSKYKYLLDLIYPGVYNRLKESLAVSKIKDLRDKEDVKYIVQAVAGGDPWAALYVGNWHFERKRYNDAQEWYSFSVKYLPFQASGIGDKFTEIHDGNTARKFYSTAIQEGDNDTYLLLALLLSNQNIAETYDLAEASEYARQGEKEGIAICRFIVAYCEVMQKKISLEDAIQLIGNVSPDEKKTFLANWIWGQIYAFFHENKKAIYYFENADKIYHYQDIRPKRQLFHLYIEENNRIKANEKFTEILELIADPTKRNKTKIELEKLFK